MIEWEPNKNDANLNMPVDGQVASICWNEQTKLLTMSLVYSAVYGMGERYNGLNQNDRIVKIEVEEKFCNQGDKSYCPSPFFFTDTGFSFCTLSGGTLIFDFTQKNVITVHAPGNCKFIFNAGTPEKLISEYMSLSGPAILPPDWVFGPWISANHWNTQKETEKQIELLKKYQFPATVLVLEAWSDEATFYIFNGAKYKEKPNGGPFAVGDFDYSESAYWPNPQEMIKKLHKAGLHLVLWQVPVYKQQSDDEIRNHQNDLDWEDAVKRSLCIHNLDGTPYKIPEGHWFPGSMIPDFTNPETCKTWFGKRQYLLDMGVDGFKTDGGEFVCTDAVSFYDGSTGKESRNCYPQQYTKAYTQFLGNNHVLFSRAGYMGQHTTPCHWGGDQQSTNDELRHVLSAGLSAALSGILFWGFDLAGFAGPLPTLDLYRRATMLACFTPIMQWHSEPDGGQFKELMPGGEGNNERSPWNMAAVYNSPEFVTEMRFWHWLRMNLQPYLMATAFRCAAEKVPMMRPLVYEWPRDKAARQVEDEFLLGDAILVAPLLEENQTAREVYLPEGEWYAFFTGKCYHGCQTISTTADMKFPVFIRGGYAVPLHADGMDSLGNPVSQNLNSKLILLVAGAAGKSTFTTNKSVLTCEWKNEKVRVEGTGAETVQIHHFCWPQEALAHSKRLFICSQKDLPMNAIIFDLDGVLCHTDEYHYMAWKAIADELHIPFNREVNNQLRGVSRMESLKLILRNSPVCYSEQEKFLLAEKKNNIYRELLQNITSKDLADGAWTVLEKLHAVHIPMAIGSSSKNTPLIVEKLGIGKFFDAIVDGNQISHSKPDPEVFLLAAEKLHQKPSDCLVVEDAEAGVKAALNGGFLVAGIGPAKDCPNVNYPLLSLSQLLAIKGWQT